jgi:hypothetical protein
LADGTQGNHNKYLSVKIVWNAGKDIK